MARATTHPVETITGPTRRHLIVAAAQVFAERGFRSATVREICRRAGANIASISYHFGDKEALYATVLRETAPTPAGGPASPYPPEVAKLPADVRLRRFVRDFLTRIAEDGPHCAHSRIMAREMIEPTQALDHLVRDFIRPQHQWFQGLIRELAGNGFPDEVIRLTANSVISQVLFYKHCGAVIERLEHADPLSPERIDQIAEHIASFSLGAIRAMARPAASRPARGSLSRPATRNRRGAARASRPPSS